MICEHLIILDLKNMVSKVQKEIEYNDSKNKRLKCNNCTNTSNLYISLSTGIIFCEKHKKDNIETNKKQDLFYSISNQYIYCNVCDNSVLASVCIDYVENCILKNVKIYNNFIFKNMMDIGKSTALSSILQILINTPDIRDHYLGFIHDMQNCKIKSCFDCVIKKLIYQLYSENPINLAETIQYVLEQAKLYENGSMENLNFIFVLLSNAYHLGFKSNPECDCIMHKNLFWLMKKTRVCTNCQHEVTVIKEFVVLELMICKDLQIVLQKLFNLQLLDTCFFCINCKTNAKIYMHQRFHTFPNILSIYFNRHCIPNNPSVKLKVDYILCIEKHKYSLLGFIVQKKKIPSYFVSYMLINNKWYEFTSEKITESANIINPLKNASMLFFQHINN